MLVLNSTPAGALPARNCSISASSPLQYTTSLNSSLFSSKKSKSRVISRSKPPLHLALAKADGGVDSGSATKPSTSTSSSSSSPSPLTNDGTVFVGQENVPLEGVIQFDKANSYSRITKWGRVALLAGGDVLALLLFSAIGRFSHGFPVYSIETLRTADPFIAGWFLSAYFLGGYAEDGRGMNGLSKAVIAAAKSWALGIPLGMIIRSVTSGHTPPYNFILVTMGSTAVLLIGWRALLFSVLPSETGKKDDVYRRGNPFELFELLTSLVRRW